MTLSIFLEQVINGLVMGSGYAVFAISFGLMMSTLGIMNLAQGVYATAATFVAVGLASAWGFPMWLGCLVGIGAAAVIGLLANEVAFEPLTRRRRGLWAPVIASIALWIAGLNLLQQLSGAEVFGFDLEGSLWQSSVEIGGVRSSVVSLISIVLGVAVAMAVHGFLQRAPLGAAIRAVGWDPDAASLAGIDDVRIRRFTVLLAAGLAGLAGVMIAVVSGSTSFTLGEAVLFKGFVALILGGFADVRGIAIAAFGLGLSEAMMAQYVSHDYAEALVFGAVLMILVVRPSGLFRDTRDLLAARS